MAEDSDVEKTEPATPQRLEKSREEGQVPRSTELATFAVVLAGAAGLWFAGGGLASDLKALMRGALSFERELAYDPALLANELYSRAVQALLAYLPFGLIVYIAAFLAPLMMSGWVFSSKALAPDVKRLNPAKGLARMFSSQSAVGLAKSLAKVAVLTAAALWAAVLFKEDVLRLASVALTPALTQAASIIGASFFALVAAMLLIVAMDIPYQLWSHHHKLRMTRDEVRRDAKESEGDPHLKAHVRNMQRETSRKRMMAQLPNADVVVTNPSRYAVALVYRGGEMRAPQVLAKGMNLIAARMLEVAAEHRIPVLEAPPLARALYRHAELEREIPAALYSAVAEVLAYVYQLSSYRAEGGRQPPVAPTQIEVPAELDPGASA
jgi:flagellar biosynthetic protein FlhB